MSKNEIYRVTQELDERGYSLTSYDQLDLPFDTELTDILCEAAARGSFSPSAADLTKHIEKQNMIMAQDDEVLRLGRLLVSPVVERFFGDNPHALGAWSLYAMNRYEEGGKLGSHQDSVGSTVFVATVSGVRKFDVYRRISVDSEVLDESFVLSPGSIMILDGEIDPSHAVECLEGPSVTAVFDVPELLRP